MPEPTLEDKLRFLRQTLARPETRAALGAAGMGRAPDGELQCIETHMSWVFLFGDRVLKLKKPVRHALLDFSTLAAREFHCHEELRLNARLAPGVYLGLVALRADGDRLWLQAVGGGGSFACSGPGGRDEGSDGSGGSTGSGPSSNWGPGATGDTRDTGAGRTARETRTASTAMAPRTVEWLVLMRRLPEARMLARRIATGTVEPREIDALARVLSDFYRRAPPAPTTPQAQVAWLRGELIAHRELLSGRALPTRWRGPEHLPCGAEAAVDRLEAAIDRHAALLAARAACTVEGHGDLRPEHVCLLDPPVVIDGLEFNAALRRLDPWDEIAFLAMECELAAEAAAVGTAAVAARDTAAGQPPAASWIVPRLLAGCAAALGGPPPAPLLPLYTALRALLRARLVLAHLQDPEPRTPERWPPLARRYLARAVAALDRIDALDAADRTETMAAALSSPAAASGRP